MTCSAFRRPDGTRLAYPDEGAACRSYAWPG